MQERQALGGKVLTVPFKVCAAIVLIALFFIGKRFIFGLGSVTNMNDGYPWGIWIAYDVVVGTALACAGYSIALIVYVFNKGEYSPLVRPALMTSMFGYTLAGISVIFDIGRYWQAYNIFLPWLSNLHSVMLEVALCIGTYILVLWLEFAPALLEKFKAERLQARLNRIIFVFIALGILLPTMHQSSLGTMMLMAGHKLSPLWWSAFLPLLFLITAVIIGYAAVIFESLVAAHAFKRPMEMHLLSKISALMPWLLGLYLVVRLEDVNLRGSLPLAFSGGLLGNLFLLENLLLLAALLILAFPNNRQSPRMLFIASCAMLLGGSMYRFNTYIVGFDPGTGWQYFPSVPELFITFGIIAAEVMAYLWFVKTLPVLPKLTKA
jgi:Ni/Fe-hydrogenase subunit HybB-like protein